ncbi:MAG: DUF6541 family protein [Candidatus Woesearchaeota archaeon]
MEREEVFTIIAILAITCLGLFARYAPYGGSIIHNFPATIAAGDPNSRLSEAEYVLESGSAKFMPPWFTGEKDLLTTQPPLNLILAAMVAGASGIKVFDTLYLDAVLASIGVALCFFVLFSRIFKNKTLGLVAATALIYPLEEFFSYQINIGMYANYSTILFYPIILLFAYEFSSKPTWPNAFLLALGFAMQFLMHSSEAVIFGAAVGSYLLIFERKSIGWKKLIGAGIIFAVLILPYIPILYSNFVIGNFGGQETSIFQGKEIIAPSYEPQIFLTNVVHPALYLFLLLAVILTWKKKEYRFLNYIFFFYIFVIFILAKFGIGTYYVTIRTRPIFFVFAYPLVAIGLYTFASSIRKFIPVKKEIFFAAFVMLLIIGQGYFVSSIQPRQGIFTEDSYKGFQWIRQNTPEDSRVLCFGCQQFEGLTMHRVVAQPMYWDERSVNQMLGFAGNSTNTSLWLELCGYSDLRLAKKGLFGFETRGIIGYHESDICGFDYFIIKPYGNAGSMLVQIGQRLLNNNATQLYSNSQMVVLKNNNKGGKCI